MTASDTATITVKAGAPKLEISGVEFTAVSPATAPQHARAEVREGGGGA